jgi:hypothetical protein
MKVEIPKWTNMQGNVMADVNKQTTSETNADIDSYVHESKAIDDELGNWSSLSTRSVLPLPVSCMYLD